MLRIKQLQTNFPVNVDVGMENMGLKSHLEAIDTIISINMLLKRLFFLSNEVTCGGLSGYSRGNLIKSENTPPL